MMNDHCNRHGVSNVLTQPTNTLNLVLIAHHSLMSTCLFGIQLFGLPVIIRYAGTGNTIGCMGYGPPYNIGRPVWDSIGEKFVIQAVFWGLDLKIYNNKLLLAKVSSKNDNGLFNFCQISFWVPPPLHQSMCFFKSPFSLKQPLPLTWPKLVRCVILSPVILVSGPSVSCSLSSST